MNITTAYIAPNQVPMAPSHSTAPSSLLLPSNPCPDIPLKPSQPPTQMPPHLTPVTRAGLSYAQNRADKTHPPPPPPWPRPARRDLGRDQSANTTVDPPCQSPCPSLLNPHLVARLSVPFPAKPVAAARARSRPPRRGSTCPTKRLGVYEKWLWRGPGSLVLRGCGRVWWGRGG